MGHPLKSYREKQVPPLTQLGLAQTLGVSRTTVARWETGTRRIDLEKVAVIARETGIPVVELRPDIGELIRGTE